jgi:hypothetical protein
MSNLWTYSGTDTMRGMDITGFEVEAIDGGIGKVDEAMDEAGASYVLIDTGPWIFGKKVMLPAGIVDHVDLDEQKVYVNRTKDEIKSAPEFDPARIREETYRGELGAYYGETGAGYRTPRSRPDRPDDLI